MHQFIDLLHRVPDPRLPLLPGRRWDTESEK